MTTIPPPDSGQSGGTVTLRLDVSGDRIVVLHGQTGVYQFEPDGEAWVPGTAPDGASWYDHGRQAIATAATRPGLIITYWPYRDVIHKAANVIRESSQ